MCGTGFAPRTSGGAPQVFCSKRCTDRAAAASAVERRASTRPQQCAECQAPLAHLRIGRPRRYCSATCTQRASNRAQRRRQLPVTPQADRACERCAKPFSPKRRDQLFCSPRCRVNAGQARRQRNEPLRQGTTFDLTCVECGTEFTALKNNAKWCSSQCRIRTNGREAARRRFPGTRAALYSDREIFERDGWICQIPGCGTPVNRAARRLDSDGATIDHVIPLSLGGADEACNVVTAHWRCNREKGNRV